MTYIVYVKMMFGLDDTIVFEYSGVNHTNKMDAIKELKKS